MAPERAVLTIACLLLSLSIASADIASLQQLATSLGGAATLGWQGTDFCKFGGVTCEGTDVKSINLGGKNLAGTLPDGIWASFPTLEEFSIRGNKISGAIPSFDGAANLRNIDLGDNQLTGSLPASLRSQAALKSVAWINLKNNPGVCGTAPNAGSPQIDTDEAQAAPCDGTATPKSPPAKNTTTPVETPDATTSPSLDTSPSLETSPSPDATTSPAVVDPTASPSLPAPAPTPTSVPSSDLAYPECICAYSFTSANCNSAMTQYCTTGTPAACTTYKTAITGSSIDSAAAFGAWLQDRCFAKTATPPKDSYCSCGKDPTSGSCSRAVVSLCANKDPLCADLINAGLGQEKAVGNVATWLSDNCAATPPGSDTKEGALLSLVLNGMSVAQFQAKYQGAFQDTLAEIVGGRREDVEVRSVLQQPGLASRRLQQSSNAVSVTTFIAGNPNTIPEIIKKAFENGDFVRKMDSRGVTVKPSNANITVLKLDKNAPPPAKKKSSGVSGTVIGIAVGVAAIVVLCILAIVVFFCMKKRKANRKPAPQMSKNWLEANPNELKPTPSTPVNSLPTYVTPPKPTNVHTGAYDATPVPVNARAQQPPVPSSPMKDPSEVVVASDSPKASATSARNRFFRQGSGATAAAAATPQDPYNTREPSATGGSATGLGGNNMTPASRFSSLPSTPAGQQSAAAQKVAAELAAAKAAQAAAAAQEDNAAAPANKQQQRAERSKFWQQFEMTFQGGAKKPAPNAINTSQRVDDDDDIPSSGTSWTSDHTMTPRTRAAHRGPFGR